ncbi:hypothetical protein ACTQ42_08470 [Streptococcus alactolyticus]|jgi:hypothetical protein|uniref:hypothetical protein n=1 Tax=Bacillota TaxID=1239 RepID=UPI001965F9E8|nr:MULTISPECIES: hypothetical protein [Bacillota]MDU2674329.1 hypothetical protein [Clostridium sp.]MDU2680216.1 hypothetical protein [Clostridium sp.]UQF29230.1 hypothetical protein M2925_05825 [Enterococcus faecalis]
MSKTTRELANLFGVTKQAIEKKYTPEFKAKYMSKVTTNGVPTWLVDDEGVNVLKSIFQDTNQTTNLGTNEVPTDDKILGVLEEQIKSQKNQIESLQKLLDQSQQLLLSEQKKSQLLIENQTPKTDVSREWKEKQAVLENQVSHYRNSANNANQRVREYQDWAERAEKGFWFAAILAGVFFVLLLVLGGLYFWGRN